jgi:hypothetical protein
MRWRVRNPKPTEIVSQLAEIVWRLQLHHVRHQGKVAPTVAEIQQLIEKITCRFSRDARVITFTCGPSLVAMAARARFDSLFHGVEISRVSAGDCDYEQQCGEYLCVH